MRLRTQMLALTLLACGPATWAADPAPGEASTTAQTRIAQLRSSTEGLPLDRQVAALQQQVAALQEQLKALQSVVRLTDTGVVLTGPAVTIAAGTIVVDADGNLNLEANNLSAVVQRDTTLNNGMSLTITSDSTATLQSRGPVDVKGTLVRLNGGTRPVATQGSLVQTTPSGAAQIVNGSPTVLAN